MVCWLFAAICLAAVLAGYFLDGDAFGVPLGSGGTMTYTIYWISAVAWVISLAVAIAQGAWKTAVPSVIVIVITIAQSAVLVAACAAGDCL